MSQNGDSKMTEESGRCQICSLPSAHKCSSCKLVGYCTREHQKQDWKNHKEICKAYEVSSSPDLGRYLTATRSLTSGEHCITDSPLVFGPYSEDIVCLGCYTPNPEEKCPLCLWPACSSSCPGLTNPDHHGAECVVLRLYVRRAQFISENFYRYEAILPLRCLLLQRRNPKKWKQLLELDGHSKQRGPKTESYQRIQDTVVNYLKENFLKVLKQLEETSNKDTKILEDSSDDIIHKVCDIIEINSLDVNLPSQSTISAVFPVACLMEHSCLPNTRHVFELEPQTFKLTVTAAKDIQVGDHLSTMYTHALWGTQQRQNHLRLNKHFTCRCKRCADPTELGTYISALRCLAQGDDKKICGGWQLPLYPLEEASDWKCNKCPTSLTSSQVLDLVNMIGVEVDLIQEQHPTVESLQSVLDKLKKLLHPHHYHCYGVMHSLIQLYGRQPGYMPDQINNSLLENKMEMCEELKAITSAIDPTSSRLALYTAVINHELYHTMMILAKRNVWTNNELSSKLSEARKLLVVGQQVLQPEVKGSPGEKVRELINSSIDELDNYAMLAKVTLEL